MKLLWILGAGILALVSTLARVEAQECKGRIRKDWDMLTATEKTTYKNAIRASMDSGAYIKFAEIHSDIKSRMEAHQQCMFGYWHRLLLVAFENMLRAQGPEFKCVTVPYANLIAASAQLASGACTSLGNCMNITRELGGFTNGTQGSVKVNGVLTTGTCIKTPPLDRFCELSSLSGTECSGCVPRTNWLLRRVPITTSYASVRAQVFGGSTIGEMSPLVEKGCHNEVHYYMGSTMDTPVATVDPYFWSHHAFVDLLHVIFHKCRVGTKRLTFAEKASHPVAWSTCRRLDGTIIYPNDTVTMQTGELGINLTPARLDPLLRPFFEGLPTTFAGLVDAGDIGPSSYGYAISGILATMYLNCTKSPISRKLEETAATDTTSTPVMCGIAEDDANNEDGKDDASKDDIPKTGYTGEDGGHKDVVIVDGSGNPIDADAPREVYYSNVVEKRTADWYEETLETMGGDSYENMFDMERQACMFENQCLGGTMDYTPEFKAKWGVKEPRCKTIVDAINNGSQSIQYESWFKVMVAQFGCPQPTKSKSTNCALNPGK